MGIVQQLRETKTHDCELEDGRGFQMRVVSPGLLSSSRTFCKYEFVRCRSRMTGLESLFVVRLMSSHPVRDDDEGPKDSGIQAMGACDDSRDLSRVDADSSVNNEPKSYGNL